MKNKIDAKYTIDEGNITLNKVSNFIVCEVCGQCLAINNKGTVLVKTFATLLDFKQRNLTLKCGKCKSFNAIKFEDISARNSKCLITM